MGVALDTTIARLEALQMRTADTDEENRRKCSCGIHLNVCEVTNVQAPTSTILPLPRPARSPSLRASSARTARVPRKRAMMRLTVLDHGAGFDF